MEINPVHVDTASLRWKRQKLMFADPRRRKAFYRLINELVLNEAPSGGELCIEARHDHQHATTQAIVIDMGAGTQSARRLAGRKGKEGEARDFILYIFIFVRRQVRLPSPRCLVFLPSRLI